mgnify:CR=1 FL=1
MLVLADVGILGFAGFGPSEQNNLAFWRNLAAGVETISSLTPEELAAAGRVGGQGEDSFHPAYFNGFRSAAYESPLTGPTAFSM